MTIAAVHHPHTTRNTALAAAGALLAAAAGFGVANLVIEDAAPLAPTNSIGFDSPERGSGAVTNGFAGTDREERQFMHRR